MCFAPAMFLSTPLNIIIYNFCASGSRYLYAVHWNIFEWAFVLFTFTFDFAITRTVKHILHDQVFVNELRICRAVNTQAWYFQTSLRFLDLWSEKSDSCITGWMLGYQVCIFFHRIGRIPRIGLWFEFPKWVKGLKYCMNYIWLKCLFWNILHFT